MAPRIPALAQSEPKSRFVQRLDLEHPSRRHIYALLTGEAVEAWNRLMNDRNALLPNLRNDPTVQPPYSVSQITETAMHREILKIYETASSQTRPYYELAHDTDSVAQENWICRWALWHVFRNRDQRKKSTTRPANARSPLESPESSASTSVTPSDQNDSPGATNHQQPRKNRSLPYDPTRDD